MDADRRNNHGASVSDQPTIGVLLQWDLDFVPFASYKLNLIRNPISSTYDLIFSSAEITRF